MDVRIKTIEVNEKKYKLQHPGAREWLKLKMSMYHPKTDDVDMVAVLDYFFEHCCFPEAGEKIKTKALSFFLKTRGLKYSGKQVIS